MVRQFMTLDIQTIFYITGTIFMILAILVLSGIGLILLYIRKKFFDTEHFFHKKLLNLTDEPATIIVDVGKTILKKIIAKTKKHLKKTIDKY